MQFPESWLREFCNPPLSSAELAETLTMGGFEVEESRPAAPPFSHIVVGEIKEAVQHPNADRLRVCQVDVGQGALLNIVCGAPNARVGIKVPCALVGAELPPGDDGKPFLIKLGKLRGVESQGMLCSARELKLSDDHGGLLELSADAPLGADVRDVLQLDDTLLTLKLTPNLAHGLSVYGIARELSALTGAPLKTPTIPPVTAKLADTVAVKVLAPELCGRFSGRVVRGVTTTAKTPAWMVDRLARCGQRSVTPLVDISNYVMFEYGQPSHIFDLDKIHGGLTVRWGQAGEQLKLLNGNTVTVDEKVGVIADEQAVESLAGIMGGDATAVSDDTKNIYVEAAFWWPEAIQGRSRRFNFSTDAGHRYERGVDPSRTVQIIERITQLVIDICGGDAGPIVDETLRLPEAKPVTLRVARAARVIGMPITQAQCVDALRRLGLPIEEGEGTVIVTPAPHRFDLLIEEDLIEEVARLIGYNNLPTTAPLAPITARVRPEAQRSRFAVRHRVAALGYQETINFSFVEAHWEQDLAGNANPVKLLNPIASQMSVMRSSLIGSLLQVLKFNLDRKAPRVRVFEAGRVFLRDDTVETTDSTVKGISQPMRLAGLAWGDAEAARWDGKPQRVDFYDVKGDVEALLAPRVPTFEVAEHPALHPGRSARVLVDGRVIGVVGELHPRWRQKWDFAQAPIVFELDLEALAARSVPVAKPVPKFQAVERDIAVVVAESVTHGALMQAIGLASTGGLLRDVVLFDIYRPQTARDGMVTATGGLAAGEKSMAVRLSFQDDAATLTDEQVDPAVRAIVDRLAADFGARLRG
ncbi:phenylalanine--tRNA ligase subunit beta [Variovorax arabinosiphilus]|uniref:phenylalanine--tRNA ligase subunit beta n=1 Tax=Variovorax arabinosiphilus TaxID=3053498 RepID=UPI0025791A12|nr:MULTISPECIES: phenylalanine--tRNA ligase subunit beta [unclassified Variovorax]MDM0120082.1 phenylalanine--tRNA ligase subunit beta [Variovorax sp. J2L1-78]MDM0128005.1 phenylalanine--tRNA ligase subunit beta [Variovorax sp. J2L1-63]MDM0231705.1 phenylalanine--tRNA ligase subunit beta [Variovorax sp. J2R1-6]